MEVVKTEVFPIAKEEDVVRSRQIVRKWSIDCAFSLVDQTKLVTAVSELARNTMIYGGGGVMRLEMLKDGFKTGVRAYFEDQGPGIPDIERALQKGYTTGSGMGLGLGGARSLCNDFDIKSEVGKGTTVMIARWK